MNVIKPETRTEVLHSGAVFPTSKKKKTAAGRVFSQDRIYYSARGSSRRFRRD
jgi:hypothetical protein